MTRKIILNLASSLDGYIATAAGKFDWIVGDGNTENDTEKKFNFESFLETCDVVVMGKLAYEDCPEESWPMYENKTVYVATTESLKNPKANSKQFKGDLVKQLLELKNQPGKNIWLYGGAGLTDAFIKANVVDEYIIGIIPIILGSGRKLFFENNPTIKLQLTESTVQEGIVINRYNKRYV